MIIDFDSIELKTLPAFKGGEKEYRANMFDDQNGKIMRGKLIPGASIGLHTHTDSSEVIFIISGSGTVIDDGGEPQIVKPGLCLYCPKGHSHTLKNTSEEGDLDFYAFVPKQ